MRRPLLAAAAFVATALLSGCPDRDVSEVNPIGDHVDTKVIPVTLNRALDILFVVDDSGSMAGEQASLVANFPTFIGVLQTIEGGLPDVHIGVVSSNVGAAGESVNTACARQGDDGNLLVKAGCTGLTGRFISDVADSTGNRVKNYTGELDTLFACIATLGTEGCGFEMHLESAYRALQPGKNPGFYRPDAYLAIVILADEDDCSTEMGAMFGATSPALGPQTSFRCHEFGVICDHDPSPRAFGTRTGCRPNPDSPYMFEIEKYVSFLKQLKADPSLVIVAGIVGVDDELHTVVVGPDPENAANPSVEASCSTSDPGAEHDGAAPPIRITEFLRQFANRHQITSICNQDLTDALTDIAELLKVAIGNPCLTRRIADRDEATTCERAASPTPAAGLGPAQGCELECSVMDVRNPNRDDREEVVVPWCATNGNATPCWKIVRNATQCPQNDRGTPDPGDDLNPDSMSIEVDRGGNAPPSGTSLEVQCVTE